MTTGYPVFIAHENGVFMEHFTIDDGQSTLCYITWESLPLNVYTDPETGETQTFEGDKPMYTDHERDDVIRCLKCDVRSRIYRARNFI